MVKRKITLCQGDATVAHPAGWKPYLVVELVGDTEPTIGARLSKVQVDDLIRRPNTTVLIRGDGKRRL